MANGVVARVVTRIMERVVNGVVCEIPNMVIDEVVSGVAGQSVDWRLDLCGKKITHIIKIVPKSQLTANEIKNASETSTRT